MLEQKEDRLKIADGVELCISKNIVDNPDAVIILLHGLCEHSGRYAGVTAHLNALGYSVYRYDHRGHGCSGGRRGYIEDFNLYIDDADKIVKLAREENSDAPIFMLGHSMGGFISASYGVKYPDRISGQILSGAAVILLPLFEELQDSVYASDPLVPIPNSLAELICRNSSVVKAYEEDPLVLKEFTTKLMSEVLIRGAKWLMKRMADYRYPCLILHGGNDQIVPPEASKYFYEHIKSQDKQLKIYDGLYHEILNEPEKEIVLDDIHQWIEARAIKVMKG